MQQNLRRIPFFGELPDPELRAIAERLRRERYLKGMDFDKIDELLRLGEEAAREALPQIRSLLAPRVPAGRSEPLG